eukprot:TRINITY_DN9838_c0_g1_i1.p1 TRINITY_DN9838_c0_g1~~TRINITY_DN9838_c0_g1_i1.p1  ORF type:complete len:384 (+),score=74.44 TRINITY_DN9838_c0_g1_i1:207-1358(+)
MASWVTGPLQGSPRRMARWQGQSTGGAGTGSPPRWAAGTPPVVGRPHAPPVTAAEAEAAALRERLRRHGLSDEDWTRRQEAVGPLPHPAYQAMALSGFRVHGFRCDSRVHAVSDIRVGGATVVPQCAVGVVRGPATDGDARRVLVDFAEHHTALNVFPSELAEERQQDQQCPRCGHPAPPPRLRPQSQERLAVLLAALSSSSARARRRAAYDKWRPLAIGRLAQLRPAPDDEEAAQQAAAVRIQSLHRGAAARREAQRRREVAAAAGPQGGEAPPPPVERDDLDVGPEEDEAGLALLHRRFPETAVPLSTHRKVAAEAEELRRRVAELEGALRAAGAAVPAPSAAADPASRPADPEPPAAAGDSGGADSAAAPEGSAATAPSA